MYMVGLIWMVQIVHYPLLAIVGTERAKGVAHEHQRRTGIVVGPPMAIEGLSTLALLLWLPDSVTWWLPWLNGIFLSVPLHEKMANNPDPTVGHRLVLTNWPRTIAWSARGVVCVLMLAQAL
jgi:hypothetical protein